MTCQFACFIFRSFRFDLFASAFLVLSFSTLLCSIFVLVIYLLIFSSPRLLMILSLSIAKQQ